MIFGVFFKKKSQEKCQNGFDTQKTSYQQTRAKTFEIGSTVYKNMAAMYSSSAGTTQPIYQRRREIYSFFDHENIFQKVEYFDGKNLFLMKFFKWNNVNGVFALLFAPDTPGIWLNPGHNFSSKLYLSTNIHTVHGNGNISFLENCGDLNELDWQILESYSPALIWECPAKRSGLLYRNRLAEILQIAGIAKQHHIELNVEKAVFHEETVNQGFSEEILPIPLAKKQLLEEAEQYDLEVPDSLIDDPYEISVKAKSFIPDKLPFFWDKEDSVLVFGSGQEALMQTLAKVLCTNQKWCTKVLLLVPDSDKYRMTCLMMDADSSDRLFMDSANILKEPRSFKQRVGDNGINVVFFSIGKKQNITEEFFQGLALCRKHKVATAFFVNEKDVSALSSDLKTIWPERFEAVCDGSNFVVDAGKQMFRVTIKDAGSIDRTEVSLQDMNHAKMRQEHHA